MIIPTTAAEQFETDSQQPLLLIKTEQASCLLALQGAHVLQFAAKGQAPLLWVSPHANFSDNAVVRGGIPVCAPWFGVNQRDPSKPSHGFLRNRLWVLAAQTEHSVHLEYRSTAADRALFDYAFIARLAVSVTDQLQLDFSIENIDQHPMPLSWALHSYHPVNDLSTASIEGLSGRNYLDNTQRLSRQRQAGNVRFNGEVDRVYIDVAQQQVLNKHIAISATNAPTAIIWNPGPSNGAALPDVGNAWNQYVCLERGAAFDNEQRINPGDSLSASVVLAHA